MLSSLDEIEFHILEATWPAQAMEQLHPTASFRRAAHQIVDAASALRERVDGDPHIYKTVRSLRKGELTSSDKWYVDQLERKYRLHGVHKPQSVREKAAAVRQQITQMERQFEDNLQSVNFELFPPRMLVGLPGDFIISRLTDDRAAVKITSRETDTEPALTFASNPDVRRQVLRLSMNRGATANGPVLRELLRLRHQLAVLYGFTDFAEYKTAGTMTGSVSHALQLLDAARRDANPSCQSFLKDMAELRASEEGSERPLEAADTRYYRRKLSERMVNGSSCMQPLDAVRVVPTALNFVCHFLGVEVREVTGVDKWDTSVRVYDVYDRDTLLGRIYMDLHRREGKPSGPLAIVYHVGAKGRRLPEAILTAVLPDHGSVEYFGYGHLQSLLHELGHVFHFILAGRQDRAGLMLPEVDFMEAPAQVLESFARDPRSIAQLANLDERSQCGEVIAGSLRLGDAYSEMQQLSIADFALRLHIRQHREPLPSELFQVTAARYALPPLPSGSSFPTTIPHLAMEDYSATYFVYVQTRIMAKKVFDSFSSASDVASAGQRFRRLVLEPGGSRSARESFRIFLAEMRGEPVQPR